MFVIIRKKNLLFFTLLLVSFCIAARCILPPARPTFGRSAGQGSCVIVIDPGHGGEDGGAVSADGVVESAINLSVARKTESLFRFLGYPTCLTRKTDVSIYSSGSDTLRAKKVSDLKNRVALVNALDDAVLISIHQNALPSSPRVHGAQVFFGKVAPSDALAASIQGALNRAVNAGNEKTQTAIAPSIYLMKNVTCPAVLIECGFMSNASEVQRLQQDDYQRLLAVTIAAGYCGAAE